MPSRLSKYATERFSVTSHGEACMPTQVGDFTIGEREGVPYADLLLDWTCPERVDEHEVRSGLFPDAEGYVKGTKTIVTYDLDLRSGSAALDADQSVVLHRSVRGTSGSGSSSCSAPSTCSPGSTTSCSCWR